MLCMEKHYDALYITEHWLFSDEFISTHIKNSKAVFYFSRKDNKHGGVAIYAKSNASTEPLPAPICKERHEMIFEIASTCIHDILLLSMYSSVFASFMNKLGIIMDLLDCRKGIIIISVNDNNTRKNNCLDNVFANISRHASHVRAFDSYLSYHLAVEFCFSKKASQVLLDELLSDQLLKRISFSFITKWIGISLCVAECIKFVNNAVDKCLSQKFRVFPDNGQRIFKVNWFNDDLHKISEHLRLLIDWNKIHPSVLT